MIFRYKSATYKLIFLLVKKERNIILNELYLKYRKNAEMKNEKIIIEKIFGVLKNVFFEGKMIEFS